MATITIKKPFTIEVKHLGHFDALPTDHKCRILATRGGIVKFEYQLGGNTYTLPTSGGASSTKAIDEADLINAGDVPGGNDPDNPFAVAFNSGTAYRVPSSGVPFKVRVEGVGADLLVTGAASAATYDSGGVVLLDASSSGNPTRNPD